MGRLRSKSGLLGSWYPSSPSLPCRSYQTHRDIRNKMRNKNLFRKDHISDLPQSITETILTKLPLRDAVRTSVLSSEWRYKWATITDLEFDDQRVSETHDSSLAEINLAKFITRFLLLHDGPIKRFALRTSYRQSLADIHQWLLFLSRKGVKELVFESERGWYKAPFCLFSCQKLVRLEIDRWVFEPPLSFKGFPLLKHLKLDYVDIAPDVIQNLISSCPLLESLNIIFYIDDFELAICAPNLKYLVLEGDIMIICLENTPKLVSISITLHEALGEFFGGVQICYFDKLFGGVPSLERLGGYESFTKSMCVGIPFGETHMTYQQLKVIELDPVRFGDTIEIMVVLQLILNAPNLQELQITGSSDAIEDPNFGFWERECPFDSTFERLKVVKMKDMPAVPHAVKFIGFLLGNSPVLETMRIIPCLYMTDEDRYSFLIELMRFRRASPEAEMIFGQDPKLGTK